MKIDQWMAGFSCFVRSSCCSEWKPADMHVLDSFSHPARCFGPWLCATACLTQSHGPVPCCSSSFLVLLSGCIWLESDRRGHRVYLRWRQISRWNAVELPAVQHSAPTPPTPPKPTLVENDRSFCSTRLVLTLPSLSSLQATTQDCMWWASLPVLQTKDMQEICP